MKIYYCTAVNEEHLNSLTIDYLRDGWNIVTNEKTITRLERDNEFITIEIGGFAQ